MINNFARRHYLTRLSVWRILTGVIGRLFVGFILACFLGYLVLLILAGTVK